MSSIFSAPETVYSTLERDTELRIALEQILYGCVPHATEKMCFMIFKENPEKIATLTGIQKISTRFFAVEKEEFPSVAMEIRITTHKGLGLKYEYFFLAESSEETLFLSTLKKLGEYCLVFLCDKTRYAVTVQMSEAEMAPLGQIVPPAGNGCR